MRGKRIVRTLAQDGSLGYTLQTELLHFSVSSYPKAATGVGQQPDVAVFDGTLSSRSTVFRMSEKRRSTRMRFALYPNNFRSFYNPMGISYCWRIDVKRARAVSPNRDLLRCGEATAAKLGLSNAAWRDFT